MLTTSDLKIRWMIRRDMPAVLAIESASFEAGAWTEEDFAAELRQRNCIGQVAEIGETILAYHVYAMHENYYDLLNLAVHPDYRRLGYGSSLVDKLKSKLSMARRRRIEIAVGERALEAQIWLRANGFRATRVLKGFGADGDDAYRFLFRLQGGSTCS